MGYTDEHPAAVNLVCDGWRGRLSGDDVAAELVAMFEEIHKDCGGVERHDYERLPSTDKRSLCRHCLRPWDDPAHNPPACEPE